MGDAYREFQPPWFHRLVENLTRFIPRGIRRRLYEARPVASVIRFFINRSLPPGRCRVTIPSSILKGTKMLLDLRYERVYWLRDYELAVQNAIAEMVKTGMVAYDIGAHIGFYTLMLSALVGEAGKVYAFEPSPANYDVLLRNIDLNNRRNVRAHALAVWKEDGQIRFRPGPLFSTTGRIADDSEANAEIIPVDAVSIDSFVHRGGNPPPDFVKVDVEGAAGGVLEGMNGIIESKRPLILVEVHNRDEQNCMRELERSFSYQLRFLEDPKDSERWLKGSRFPYHVLACP